MSQHKGIFDDYQHRNDVELDENRDNPEKKYKFGEEIGRGAFAIIKRCQLKDDKDKPPKAYIAKIIKFSESQELDEDEKQTEMLIKRETAMIQQWKHERFIALIEVYNVRKYYVLIMEWFDAVNLLPYLIKRQQEADNSKRKAKLSEKDVALLTKQILEALKYLHDQSIAYLDLKPDNIMVASNGNVKLVDYDNCRHIVSKQGDVVDCIGTPELTAPEALVFENCSGATDMWSVGCLMYLMLTAESLYAAPNEEEVHRNVAKVQYKLKAPLFGRTPPLLSEYAVEIIKGVMHRIPEKRLTIDAILNHKWQKKDVIWSLSKNPLPATTADFIKLKDQLGSLESEESTDASGVLRSLNEDPYDTPDDDSDEEQQTVA